MLLIIVGKMNLVKSVLYPCSSCHLGQSMPKVKNADVQLVLKAYNFNLAIIYLAFKEFNILALGCDLVL